MLRRPQGVLALASIPSGSLGITYSLIPRRPKGRISTPLDTDPQSIVLIENSNKANLPLICLTEVRCFGLGVIS